MVSRERTLIGLIIDSNKNYQIQGMKVIKTITPKTEYKGAELV